ncbi:hypothetical protein [Entomohabitans teleogrylli]|uniref:hypothetical protein n=1 Tax=Entomohabitans teleogrylli TaxID=1384589 RepID=UPI00073DA380|nr:hypothetical protein [Entomohabitans teleogrylli]
MAGGKLRHKTATDLLFDSAGKLRDGVKVSIQYVDLGKAEGLREMNRILRHYEQKAMDFFENIPKATNSANQIRAAAINRVEEFAQLARDKLSSVGDWSILN